MTIITKKKLPGCLTEKGGIDVSRPESGGGKDGDHLK